MPAAARPPATTVTTVTIVDVGVLDDALHNDAVANDVVPPVRREEVPRRAEPPRDRRSPAVADGIAVHPNVARRHRGPTDVVVSHGAGTPHHPSRRVNAARDPGPSARSQPNPATVMERDVAPVVIALPEPLAVVPDSPPTRRPIRGKLRPDLGRIRYPDGAVLRVVDPCAVRGELLAKCGKSGGVGVGFVVVITRRGHRCRGAHLGAHGCSRGRGRGLSRRHRCESENRRSDRVCERPA